MSLKRQKAQPVFAEKDALVIPIVLRQMSENHVYELGKICES